MEYPNCPKCNSEYTYAQGNLLICPMCTHEWTKLTDEIKEQENAVKDAYGKVIVDGCDLIINENLKLGSDTLKQGIKVKNITLLEVPHNGHEILAKIDGHGQIYLKGSVVRLA